MTTRVFRFRVLVAVCGLLFATGRAGADEKPVRPNVLVFLIDDLGGRDIAVDGSTFHETPHIDALARSGVRFTDFYSAHPVCSPTRAALMTGKVPQRLGITDWIHAGTKVALPAAEETLGEAFQSHGYQTAYFGKWHLGESDADFPKHHGFEWTRCVNRGGQPASYYAPFRRPGKGDEPNSLDVPDLADAPQDAYLTDVLTGRAIEFLRERDAARPFLLCFGHYAVHTPIQPPKGLPAKYQEKRAKVFGAGETPTVPAPFDAVSRGRQDNPDYAAMVENLDMNIGRMIAALDELKLRENTIVVFTSDNGGLCTLARGKPGPTCNLPLRSGKGWTYEGGIRIATSISWPAGLQPAVANVPAYTADLYPTLLELCGLPLRPEQHRDGTSLAGVLRGGEPGPLRERDLAWYYPHEHGSGHKPSAAIRRGRWKLVHFLGSGRSELFDLENDPGETTDLSAVDPNGAARLEERLKSWIAETTR